MKFLKFLFIYVCKDKNLMLCNRFIVLLSAPISIHLMLPVSVAVWKIDMKGLVLK